MFLVSSVITKAQLLFYKLTLQKSSALYAQQANTSWNYVETTSNFNVDKTFEFC